MYRVCLCIRTTLKCLTRYRFLTPYTETQITIAHLCVDIGSDVAWIKYKTRSVVSDVWLVFGHSCTHKQSCTLEHTRAHARTRAQRHISTPTIIYWLCLLSVDRRVIIYTTEVTEASYRERNCQCLEPISSGFEPDFLRMRVQRSTFEIYRPNTHTVPRIHARTTCTYMQMLLHTHKQINMRARTL